MTEAMHSNYRPALHVQLYFWAALLASERARQRFRAMVAWFGRHRMYQ